MVGFRELSQDDQITLIKQGSFEVIFARYTTLFSEQGMFLPDMTARIPRSIAIVKININVFQLMFILTIAIIVLRAAVRSQCLVVLFTCFIDVYFIYIFL